MMEYRATTLPPHTATCWGVLRVLLLLCCWLPLGGTTGMVFTVFDVFADLESWGRITVGRFNATSASAGTGNGWPIPQLTSQNSQTMEITEIRLLDAKGNWVKSHRFDSSSRNFAVSNWETETFDFRSGAFRAHARRIETIRLGELSGQVNMAVYVATENVSTGVDNAINVTRGDVMLMLEFLNVTEGCHECVTLEVVVSFWGRARGQSTSATGLKEVFMLPARTRVWLPNTVLLDGNLTDLTNGSPEFEQRDSAFMTTLRMPVFNTSAAYSATLRVGGESNAHLLKEQPVHRVYGESSSVTTDSSLPETTEKEREKPRHNKHNIANPEYRHVKDSSVTEHGHSKASPSHQYHLATILFAFFLIAL